MSSPRRAPAEPSLGWDPPPDLPPDLPPDPSGDPFRKPTLSPWLALQHRLQQAHVQAHVQAVQAQVQAHVQAYTRGFVHGPGYSRPRGPLGGALGVPLHFPWDNPFAVPVPAAPAQPQLPASLHAPIGTAASAFHKVTPSRQEHAPPTGCLPASYGATKQKTRRPPCLESPASLQELCEAHNLADNPDNPRSPENDLPLKKRNKPRTANDKMSDGTEEADDAQELSPKEIPAARLKVSEELKHKWTSMIDIFSHCRTCTDMNSLKKCGLSLSGSFKYWDSQQVQFLLWRELQKKVPSPHSLCSMLVKLEGLGGSAVSTYTKEDFEMLLAGTEVSVDSVWECISNAIKSDVSPLQPYNSCEPHEHIQRQPITNLSHMKKKKQSWDRSERMSVTTSLTKPRRRRDKCVGQLWEFVYTLLRSNETNPSVVCWEDEKNKLFRIVNTEEIARLWGKHKGNSNMTYANMSRTMRYYREGNGAFVRNERKRVYGFGPKADFERFESKISKRFKT